MLVLFRVTDHIPETMQGREQPSSFKTRNPHKQRENMNKAETEINLKHLGGPFLVLKYIISLLN